MTYTEEEAREKWCPFGKVEDACCASECMAWRWDMTWDSATEEGHGGDLVVRLKRRKGDPKRGFCGLAGKAAND